VYMRKPRRSGALQALQSASEKAHTGLEHPCI
jgi:hypothetical protein